MVRSGASAESWVADAWQAADGWALAFEEGEGKDEEANAHDPQDDHARDERACHCVHLERRGFQMGWGDTHTQAK